MKNSFEVMRGSEELVISGTRLLKYRGSAARVEVPEGITEIGEAAFFGCDKLEEVSLPESLERVMFHAFYGCTALRSAALPASVTEIGDRAFYKCRSLQKLEVCLPEGAGPETSPLIAMGGDVLGGCDALHEFAGAAFEKDGCICIGSTLVRYAGEARQLRIPAFACRIAGYAFSWCKSLQELVIPPYVKHIDDFGFANCVKLRSISFESEALSFGHCVFFNCPALREVNAGAGLLSPGPLDPLTVNNEPLKRTLFLSCLRHPSDYGAEQAASWEAWLLEVKENVARYAIERDDVFALKFYLDRGLFTDPEAEEWLALASKLGRAECAARLLDYKKSRGASSSSASLFDILGEF
jgi:hypothetical protein